MFVYARKHANIENHGRKTFVICNLRKAFLSSVFLALSKLHCKLATEIKYLFMQNHLFTTTTDFLYNIPCLIKVL